MKKGPSQTEQLYVLLKDYRPHHIDEVLDKVYGSVRHGAANVTARVSDLRKKGYDVRCTPDKQFRSQSWYQLVPHLPPAFPAPVAPPENKEQKLFA